MHFIQKLPNFIHYIKLRVQDSKFYPIFAPVRRTTEYPGSVMEQIVVSAIEAHRHWPRRSTHRNRYDETITYEQTITNTELA